MCKSPSSYICLYDVTFRVNVYKDKCYRPRILAPGYKYVYQPNLNRASCNVTRYQPFIFDTIGSSDCTFLKSVCNSEGQSTYDNGTTKSDRTCKCNTDRGYTYVKEPKNHNYCNPSNEDCSCHMGTNPKKNTIGSIDFKYYEEINITPSQSRGNTFNMSKEIKIFDFDNYKYNIACPTRKFKLDKANKHI
ncbi:uncharacterized protein LOC127724933 [Mytilus californianus]|uniref:uncharacterized protein LOC127724933 n=1 Tax=Mytilus californianus TaxID=6549 RepID=UPI0022464E34|nr:uncharacterized protein LOC127724933 [Mytilus californianus]